MPLITLRDFTKVLLTTSATSSIVAWWFPVMLILMLTSLGTGQMLGGPTRGTPLVGVPFDRGGRTPGPTPAAWPAWGLLMGGWNGSRASDGSHCHIHTVPWPRVGRGYRNKNWNQLIRIIAGCQDCHLMTLWKGSCSIKWPGLNFIQKSPISITWKTPFI